MTEIVFDLPTAPRVTHPETKQGTKIEVVETPRAFAAFQRVPEIVHWGDPYFVRTIRSEERALFDRAKNPFFGHGEARLWTAWHGHGQPVGRIAAFLDRDHDARTGRRTGFFGWFDYMNDARVPAALLGAAGAWLREGGAAEILGPVRFSSARREGRGMLVDGFHDDPVAGAAYNPASYPGFLVPLGLEKAFDEYAYEVDSSAPPPAGLAEKARAVAERDGLTVRPLDVARFAEEWETIRAIRDEANRPDPRHVPLPKEDFHAAARAAAALVAILPGGALVLVEKGKPGGFALALVDWNRVLKHLNGSKFPLGWIRALLLKRTIDRVVLGDMAVLGAGRGRALPLVHALLENLRARGYARLHVGPVAEDNARARAILERLGARRSHAWRTYRVPAAPRSS